MSDDVWSLFKYMALNTCFVLKHCRNQNQELHMANVNKIREGVYTCRAANTYGAAESTAYLKVLCKLDKYYM